LLAFDYILGMNRPAKQLLDVLFLVFFYSISLTS